jgi:hypothetical protein
MYYNWMDQLAVRQVHTPQRSPAPPIAIGAAPATKQALQIIGEAFFSLGNGIDNTHHKFSIGSVFADYY